MDDEERSYVFKPKSALTKPTKRGLKAEKSSPTKRQKREAPKGLDASRGLREDICRELWNYQRDGIQSVLDEANTLTLDQIECFLRTAQIGNESSIPTGFVMAGPDTTSHATFFAQLKGRIEDDSAKLLVSLNATECSNLRSALKALIYKVIDQDDDVQFESDTRYLDYDLQMLASWLQQQDKSLIAIAFEDSEAFQPNVLTEIIDQISVWADRVPAVLLFGVATSIEVFQDRLPQAASRCLNGRHFDAVQSDELLSRIFSSTIVGINAPFRIGPNLAKAILKRPKENIQSPNEFIDAFQYSFMCHFYSNPLSIFLRDDLRIDQVPDDHFEAIRLTQSFRKLTERLLEDDDNAMLGVKMLDSNKDLLEMVLSEIQKSRESLDAMTTASQILEAVRNQIPGLSPQSLSQLYLLAFKGDVLESAIFRELMLSLRKTSSDLLTTQLTCISSFFASTPTCNTRQKECDRILKKLDSLLQKVPSAELPLRSKHDLRNQTARTTVVAQKVGLQIHETRVSEHAAKYSELLEEFVEWFQQYMKDTLVSIDDVLFSEVIVYDNVYPDSAVFTPRSRPALERALTSPHDYLNCSCCTQNEEGNLLASQPSTALLYQLYQESGTAINVSDLWNAFIGVLGEEQDEQQAMFLFQRSLAEMRHFGMFKSTKKKTDHIIRTQWRGL